MQTQAGRVGAGIVIGVAAAVLLSSAFAQTAEPIVGTWKLDAAKSSYKPGPPLKSATVAIEPAGKGIKIAVEAVNPDGSPGRWGFTTARDGRDVPVTGNPMYDTAATTQASPTAGTTEYKKGGKVVMTTRLAISADGKTMTLTSTGTDPRGQAVHNVSVFTKQ
jgi:hypothetical protein